MCLYINKEEKMNNTYKPNPINTSDINLPEELEELRERIAENVHDIWAKQRINQGWTYGQSRNDSLKKHPCLVPYQDLPETEKEYDRSTAMETLKLILKLGWEINRK